MLFGGPQVPKVGLRGNLAEEAEDPRLVAALRLPVREVEGAPGDRTRVVSAAGHQMRLAEVGQEERVVDGARRRGVGERLLHEDHALREAARQRIRVAEMPGRGVKEVPHLGDPAQLDGALEQRDGLEGGRLAGERRCLGSGRRG